MAQLDWMTVVQLPEVAGIFLFTPAYDVGPIQPPI
jgi:hypothetical protein